jgi:multidrug efflux pump subunit AcrA (membrane-fusion protein)
LKALTMLSSLVRAVPLVIAAVVGGLIAAWFLRAPAPVPQLATAAKAYDAPEPASVEVSQMPAAARVELGGYVEPRNTVRLFAQAPGRVVYLAGQEGDRVAAGEVVVALDTRALDADYRTAWANLASQTSASVNAQAQLYNRLYGQPTMSVTGGPVMDVFDRRNSPFTNMAHSMQIFNTGHRFMGPMTSMMGPMTSMMGPMTRMMGMMGMMGGGPMGGGPMGGGPYYGRPNYGPNPYGYGGAYAAQMLPSFPAMYNAREAYEQQQAALVGAQANIDKIDAMLRDRRSISPRAGVILKRFVRVGDIVQPGQPLADIADVDQLDVVVQVPVAQVSQVRLGDAVPVTVNGANLWTTVRQIFPAANADEHTVTVKFALPQGALVAAGMYARVWIAQAGGLTPSTLTPAIPTRAIAYRGSLPVAFVITAHGPEMRVLRLGDTMGGRTAVLAGLTAGERVIANPSPDLKSGESPSGPASSGE